jgi:hypothetical protein
MRILITLPVLQICANYFAGTVTGCAGYPNEIYEAPYYCALQIGELLTKLGVANNLQNLKGNAVREVNEETEAEVELETSSTDPGNIEEKELSFEYVNEQYRRMNLQFNSLADEATATPPFNPANISLNGTTLTKYLKSNMTQNCRKRCFQHYISRGNALFAGSCRAEVYNPNNQANYKFLKLLSMYQEYRNQVCVENPTPAPGIHANCYDALNSLGGSSSSSDIADSILFSMTCEYHIPGVFDYQVQSMLASRVAKLGCCFANQIGMLTQNPIKPPPLVFPPCLLRYFSVNAKTISPSTYCTYRANGNITVYEFNMNITNAAGGLTPVDVYDSSSLLIFQGIIIGVLSVDTTITSTLPPYTLNVHQPFQPEVINYLYYKGSELLTPSNGYTNTSDYQHADRVALTMLLVFEGFTSPEEITSISSFVESPAFPTYMGYALNKVYHQTYAVTVATQNHQISKQYIAEPIQLSAASILYTIYVPILATIAAVWSLLI